MFYQRRVESSELNRSEEHGLKQGDGLLDPFCWIYECFGADLKLSKSNFNLKSQKVQ